MLATGVMNDDDLRVLVGQMVDDGLTSLPPLLQQPPPDFFLSIRRRQEATLVRLLRIETEKASYSVMRYALDSGLQPPTDSRVKNLLQTFKQVELRALYALSRNTLMTEVGSSK
jgi:hypothetical protein